MAKKLDYSRGLVKIVEEAIYSKRVVTVLSSKDCLSLQKVAKRFYDFRKAVDEYLKKHIGTIEYVWIDSVSESTTTNVKKDTKDVKVDALDEHIT